MGPTKKDKRQDFLLNLIKPFAKFWMLFDLKATYIYADNFDRKRKEPYVLLANHTFMFDVVQVPMYLKKVPFIVASHNLFTKQPLKFLLEEIAHVIPKTKNSSDLRTARGLIGAVKRGYPICIFPEGNTTFNGETTYVEESTMKLIKKLKVDVVICNAKGGYLSKPRWATGKRKNRKVQFSYNIVIKRENLKTMTIEEISKTVNEALYNNDYVYQREVMIKHKGKKLAEGLENILYICPECETFGSLETQGNQIKCNHCNNIGEYTEYGFIDGFKFDNTVDWDRWQRKYDSKIKNEIIESPIRIYEIDDISLSRKYLGEGTIKYENLTFKVSGALDKVFEFDKVKIPIITLRRNFNITYEGVHYLIKIEKYVTSFLRVIQDKY